jgi:genome maintenance exonuclease 1
MKTFNHIDGLPELAQLNTEDVDGKRHYRLPNGLLVPSVTTVLGYFKQKSLAEWRSRVGHDEANRISRTASTRGTKFHTLMEKYLDNEPVQSIITPTIMPTLREAFGLMRKTVDRHVDNIHYIEAPLYSTNLRLAGRTDIIGEFDGELSVIDFKTSAKEKKEKYIEDYFLQSTAYSTMYEELVGLPIRRIVVMISTDGLPEPQVFVKQTKDFHDLLKDRITMYFKKNGNPNDNLRDLGHTL